MGITEWIMAVLGAVTFFMSMMVRSERSKRKHMETKNDHLNDKVNELETEAMNLNQRAESAEALQKIEHERRKADDEITVTPGKRSLGHWVHDDTE